MMHSMIEDSNTKKKQVQIASSCQVDLMYCKSRNGPPRSHLGDSSIKRLVEACQGFPGVARTCPRSHEDPNSVRFISMRVGYAAAS